jgi:hypothetical protein
MFNCLQTRKRNGITAVNLKYVLHFPIQSLLEAFPVPINTELDICAKMHAGLHISVVRLHVRARRVLHAMKVTNVPLIALG